MRVNPELIRIFVIIYFSHGVDNDCFLRAYSFALLRDAMQNMNKHRAMFSDEKLVNLAMGRRISREIVQRQFYHAFDNSKVVILFVVIVSALDHARIDRSHVYLTKLAQ